MPYGLARAWLMRLDPERAHALALLALEGGFYPRAARPDDTRLGQELWGLSFPNPVGMAAGFDKDGRVAGPLLAAGFGFAEVGTVTLRPQAGNPRPRVFRLVEDRAIVNRLGFNSQGADAVLARLRHRRGAGVIGVNVGANADSDDRIADLIDGLAAFAEIADYLVVNISSPNTPGLRDLQRPENIDALLTKLMQARSALGAESKRPPVLVKLAPDIADAALVDVVASLRRHGIDGIVVSNTTVARGGLGGDAHAAERGGLSGRPLFTRATRMLARVRLLTEGQVPLIGVGGIDSGARAVAKVRAGASLLQLYTGLVYEGPGLLDEIKAALVGALDAQGLDSIAGLVGTDAQAWAETAIE